MVSRRQRTTILIAGTALAMTGPAMALTGPASAAPHSAASAVSTGAVAKAVPDRVAMRKKKGYHPANGAIFNIPHSKREFKIENKIYRAINHAHKGSYIKFALYSFDRVRMAKALIRAKHRGVRVQVLTNDNHYTHAQHMLRHALGKRNHHPRGSFFRRCTKGCRTSAGFLHTKILLFSHTGIAKDVVMLGSVNLTMNAVRNQYNDLWTRHDNHRVWSWFADLFNQMRKDKSSSKQHPKRAVNENWPASSHINSQKWIRKRLKAPTGRLLLQALAWPHHSAHNDPIMDILNQVHCSGAGKHAGNHGHTIVRAVMHAWNGKRGRYIAKKFRSLRNSGCKVQILYGMAGRVVRNVFARSHMRIRSTGLDTNYDGDIDLYTHQKELMVSGHYGNKPNYHLVVTGSSNYSNTDIHGDEILMLIPHKSDYNAYTRNFKALWRHHSRKLYYVGRISARASARAMRAHPEPRAAGPAWEND